MGMVCAYCASDVDRHEPVYVTENPTDTEHEAFCNYACLSAYIEANQLTFGAACEWES
ncbi:hypothetical protein [Halovivax asiaticus]|nr:hypothetical protein [Halovivax asiaticus]